MYPFLSQGLGAIRGLFPITFIYAGSANHVMTAQHL